MRAFPQTVSFDNASDIFARFALLNTHDLRTQGIARGRDISRLAIKKKEERLQALIGRIEVLEAEREGWRVAQLKREGDARVEKDGHEPIT